MDTLRIDRSKVWTMDDYLTLGESKQSEIINGGLFVNPVPGLSHQIILSNLNDIIKAYAKKVNGFAMFSPVDVYLDQKNVFQPDLVYVRKENLSILTERGLNGAPDLVVEIISPSNGFKDRNQKKDLYKEFGVKEYWIIDPGNRTIEIYDFALGENPALYLVEEGTVTSTLLPGLAFSFANLFNP